MLHQCESTRTFIGHSLYHKINVSNITSIRCHIIIVIEDNISKNNRSIKYKLLNHNTIRLFGLNSLKPYTLYTNCYSIINNN